MNNNTLISLEDAPNFMIACPFCGDSKVKITHINRGDYYQGLCNKCHSRGPKTHSINDAIEKWNHREIATKVITKYGRKLLLDKAQLNRFLKGEIVLHCTDLMTYEIVLQECKESNIKNCDCIDDWLPLWHHHKENTTLDARSSIVNKDKPWLGYSSLKYFKSENKVIEKVKIKQID